MITIKRSSSTLIILLFTALLCGPLYAEDNHGHGGGHGYNNNGYNGHGGNNGYNGNHYDNDSVGVYFGGGPYYYPYSPYYYPYGNYIVVSPDNNTYPVHKHVSSTKANVTVMKAQVELVSEGYYNGSVDGILGNQTAAAIVAFQHNKGLAETGKLDDATLKALNVPKAAN